MITPLEFNVAQNVEGFQSNVHNNKKEDKCTPHPTSFHTQLFRD
jgi:hypothetical protein